MKTKITIIGMLLLVSLMSFAQKKATPYHQWSVGAGYLISSHKDNANPNQPLFGGNGVATGISHRWGDRWGIRSRVGYTTGATQSGVDNYVASLPVPPKYKVEQTKTNWSQIATMVGPSLNLGKKHQFELSALGGISLNPSVNTVRIDAYDADFLIGTVYQAKEKSVMALWEVGASYKLALLSKKGTWLKINAGYGSNGIRIGLGIALKDCHGMPCCRCSLVGCRPCATDAESKVNK